MARPRWHKAVEQALEKVGEDWGYEVLRPRVIHFHREREFQYYQYEYHPDVCWLYRGKSKEEPNAIIWEIEAGYPDYKRVCGDIVLGGQVVSSFVDCYLWKDETQFGTSLQEDMELALSGKVRRKIVYRKKERTLIHPNVRALFVVVQDYEDDFRRYVDTIQNITGIVSDAKVFSIPKGMHQMQIENRLKRLRWLREKYKS